MSEPYNRETANPRDRVAWALCQIIDDDAPLRWTRYRGAAACVAMSAEMMQDLAELHAAMGGTATLTAATSGGVDDAISEIIRDVCEHDPADPADPDTVSISVQDLLLVLTAALKDGDET